MKSEWAIWRKALSIEECDSIIERCKTLDKQIAGVGGEIGGGINDKIRRSEVKWMDEKCGFKDVFQKVWDLTIKVNKKYFEFHIDTLNVMQFTEYCESYKGEYKRHQDIFWKCEKHRKLSMVLQLTDPSDYEGGKLMLDCQERKPENYFQKGTCIWFPATTYHWVTPVTKGLRNSVVCWFEGPHWR